MATSGTRSLGDKAASTMRVIGAILLAAGTVHFYADRVVFDSHRFAARAAASLADPRVSGYVAERIADGALARNRDLTAYRPLIVGTARAVVASEPFRAGFGRGAESAHAALFSRSAEKVALSLPDLGVLLRGALAHDPALAQRLPPSFREDLAVRPTGRVAQVLVTLARLGHRFRRNAVLGLGAGGLLLLLGVVLPADRRRALLRGGATLAATALVLFFLPPLTRAALTLSIADPELRPVAAGVFDAFSRGLRLWALVLAGSGVVLAAAASSFASHLEIEEAVRRTWSRLQRPARSRRGEIVRAVALIAVGAVAALRPAATVEGLAVAAGALLAFEGLRELFLLVPPRVRAAADHGGDALAGAGEKVDEWEGARTWLRSVVVSLLVVGLIASAVLFVRSPAALPEAPALTDACNGDRALCGRRLDQVTFAGAHNSMSAAEFEGWMFPNQEKGSVALLEHGVRALLFDVHYGTPIGGRVKTDLEYEAGSRAKFDKAVGKEAVDAAMRIRDRLTGEPTGPRAPYLCHGFCELGASPLVGMLEGVRDFLVEHPGEVLLFVIEDYVAPADVEAAFRQSGLARLVYRGGVSPPLPTLREMIEQDQRVVVFGENETAGVPWYHPAFETIQETPYTFHAPTEFSCRPNRGGTSGPLFQVNHWIETTPTPKPSNAALVNAHDFLLARARQCERERGRRVNILAVDFALTGDVVGATAELNGLATEPPADPQGRGGGR
jgi:hypothetical protein